MTPLQAIILGLLQGLTEFLPVSSSGHLVLVPWLLGWSVPGVSFDVVVHLGTLLAIVAHLWDQVGQLIRGAWQLLTKGRITSPESRLAWLVVVSAVPGGLLGFFLEDLFAQIFHAPLAVAALLVVTGVLLVICDRLARVTRVMGDLRTSDALLIGLAQGAAIAPGISRSGATISAGLLRGLSREDAGRFAFLMALPIIAGATGFSLLKLATEGIDPGGVALLVLGFCSALISGYVAIRFFLRYIREHSLRPFAYYCWGMAALSLIVAAVR